MFVSSEEEPQDRGSDRSEYEEEHGDRSDLAELRRAYPVALRERELDRDAVVSRQVLRLYRDRHSVVARLHHDLILVALRAVRAGVYVRLAEVSLFRQMYDALAAFYACLPVCRDKVHEQHVLLFVLILEHRDVVIDVVRLLTGQHIIRASDPYDLEAVL